MSRKSVYGITLSAEERRMAGYDRTPGIRQPTPPEPASSAPRSITFHACTVTLPDGTACQAHYTRSGYSGHSYYFQAPLSERLYEQGELDSQETIEARAQELVGRAWRQAQQAEQKTMRLSSAPSHLVHTLDSEPQLQRKTVQQLAGLYAVCLRYPSGALTPLSAPCEQPAVALTALKRMQEGDRRMLVIGLCCRWARRWQLPRFLADMPDGADEAGGSRCRRR